MTADARARTRAPEVHGSDLRVLEDGVPAGRARGADASASRERSLRRWLLPRAAAVVLAALAGGALGGLYGSLRPPPYLVSGEVQVSADVDLTGGQAVGQVSAGDVATQQALLTSQAVRQAAAAQVGAGVGTARTTTASDSSVISLTVTAATPDLAQQSLDAYLRAYLELVAGQQRTQIESRLDVLDGRADAADGQIRSLDEAVASSPADQRAAVVGQQSAERSSAVAERLEDQQRSARLRSALDRLPVNIDQLVAQGVEPEPSGLTTWQWTAAGALLLAGACAIVLVRLAERDRRRR